MSASRMVAGVVVLVVCGGVLAQDQQIEIPVGEAVYPNPSLTVVDETTVVVQGAGPGGAAGDGNDTLIVVRDLGGLPTAHPLVVGATLAEPILFGPGLVAAVAPGLDQSVGTFDDLVVIIAGAGSTTPVVFPVSLPGNFVGGGSPWTDVRTNDVLSVAADGLLVAHIDGSTLSPSTSSDALVFIDMSGGSPAIAVVDAGEKLFRAPVVRISDPADDHEVLAGHGRGVDGEVSTGDDRFLIVERVSGGPWTVRGVAVSHSLIDGGRRAPSRFSADTCVGLAVDLGGSGSLGYTPGSLQPSHELDNLLLIIRGLATPGGVLTASTVTIQASVSRIAPGPWVRGVSVWMPRFLDQLVEVTQVETGTPSVDLRSWGVGLPDDPEISFVGQNLPVGTGSSGLVGIRHPSKVGWSLHEPPVSQSLVMNDGVIVQIASGSIAWVSDILGEGDKHYGGGTGSWMHVAGAKRLSSGSFAVPTAGYDQVAGTVDDGVAYFMGVTGVTPYGLGHPDRDDGGPSLRLEGSVYPRAVSTQVVTLLIDAHATGVAGSWRHGFLLGSPWPSYQQFQWGRGLLGYADPVAELVVLANAGVGASGQSASYLSLPGNPALIGEQAALQWIVHNPQSPWGYDTSNGLLFTFGL